MGVCMCVRACVCVRVCVCLSGCGCAYLRMCLYVVQLFEFQMCPHDFGFARAHTHTHTHRPSDEGWLGCAHQVPRKLRKRAAHHDLTGGCVVCAGMCVCVCVCVGVGVRVGTVWARTRACVMCVCVCVPRETSSQASGAPPRRSPATRVTRQPGSPNERAGITLTVVRKHMRTHVHTHAHTHA